MSAGVVACSSRAAPSPGKKRRREVAAGRKGERIRGQTDEGIVHSIIVSPSSSSWGLHVGLKCINVVVSERGEDTRYSGCMPGIVYHGALWKGSLAVSRSALVRTS
jgi:hypothetical protein